MSEMNNPTSFLYASSITTGVELVFANKKTVVFPIILAINITGQLCREALVSWVKGSNFNQT